jgi:surfactin synthase thioesterase subunit
MTMSKTPKKTQKQIALVYEKCWNEVVSQMAPWRRKVITENFEVIDGHHVYPNRKDQEIAAAAAHQASKDADAIIYEMFTGKY